MLKDIDLSHSFGITEMEVAAVQIIKKCRLKGTWLCGFSYEDMECSDNDYSKTERVGFLNLIRCGYLDIFYYKAIFFITQHFIDLVRKHTDISDLGFVAPTYNDWLDKFLPIPAPTPTKV